MVLRGCSLSGRAGSPEGCAAIGGAAGPEAAAGRAAGIAARSRLMMRPPVPLPCTRRRSIPFSAAILRARGEALMRTLSVVMMTSSGVMSGTGAAAIGSSAFCPDGVAAPAGPAGAAAVSGPGPASASRAVISSPFSPMIASSPPTGTLPPSGTTILSRVPASKASSSMVALSLSASATTSPASTVSPSLLCHFSSTPRVMVSLSFGMVSLLAIYFLFILANHSPIIKLAQRRGGRREKIIFQIFCCPSALLTLLRVLASLRDFPVLSSALQSHTHV